DIPDYASGLPGEIEVELSAPGAMPAGAIITEVVIRDLDVNHDCLSDLELTLIIEGVEEVLWLHDGVDCKDGGLDDDSLPLTGGDINFDDRRSPAFRGRPADVPVRLRAIDRLPLETGEIADLDIEVRYIAP